MLNVSQAIIGRLGEYVVYLFVDFKCNFNSTTTSSYLNVFHIFMITIVLIFFYIKH